MQDGLSHHTNPLEPVWEGMDVLDADGEHVGKVNMVKMGDPDALTAQGNEIPVVGGGAYPPLVAATGVPVGGAIGPMPLTPLMHSDVVPDVAEPRRSDLLRTGYIRVNSDGWFASDRYVSANEVEGVEDNTVHLRLHKSQLRGDE
jgi:hypothetical protein